MRKNKYFQIFSTSFLHSFKNIKTVIGLGLFLVICLIIFANLWQIIAVKTKSITFDQSQLLWYVALNQWILIAIPRIDRNIQSDYESGRLEGYLTQPISYLGYTISDALGSFMMNFLGLATITTIAIFFLGANFDFSILQWFCFIILGFVSGLLGIVFLSVIGLFVFWLNETDPISWVWEKLLFALGGLILPLSFYPDFLHEIARFTPFSLILGARSSLAFDFSIQKVLQLLFLMVIWLAIGVFSMKILYKKGVKRLLVNGE